MEDYTIDELKEIVTTLKVAYKTAAQAGGVTSYTIKSGQGENTVTQASLGSIRAELNHFTYLLNERLEQQNGSHCTFVRSAGI
ncbi:MAG: hypothetical protein J5606_02040 [Bacteroidales bacterium]|jgi:hypothetical protein|nr:hypothetical protein [Bacteroidales bacterium]